MLSENRFGTEKVPNRTDTEWFGIGSVSKSKILIPNRYRYRKKYRYGIGITSIPYRPIPIPALEKYISTESWETGEGRSRTKTVTNREEWLQQ